MSDVVRDVVSDVVAAVRERVSAALAGMPPLVLAVSGGRDSVVLLDAVLAVSRARVRGVSTFDHGTGPGARAAVRHVRELGRSARVRVFAGRAPSRAADTEAGWRAARWCFLRRTARGTGGASEQQAVVVTGHTEDDQLETVLMRVLRGAGPRGLAAMYAPTAGVLRPLLGVPAHDVAAYAAARGLDWVEDATNASAAHLRNRVRHAVLPAALLARPGLRAELLALSRAAAAWRAAVDAAASSLLATPPDADEVSAVVPLAHLAAYDADSLGVLWPALTAHAGVRLDRRGTERLVAFTTRCVSQGASGGVPAGSVPVAGRAAVSLERVGRSPERAMVVRRSLVHRSSRGDESQAPVVLTADTLAGGVQFGRWHIVLAPSGTSAAGVVDDAGHPWRAWLPTPARYVVRAWRPGDRMQVRPDRPARRVKRYFADRQVPAAERVGWPVVVAAGPADVAGGEVVWIPGVRCSDAAPARPGQPGFVLLCTRTP